MFKDIESDCIHGHRSEGSIEVKVVVSTQVMLHGTENGMDVKARPGLALY